MSTQYEYSITTDLNGDEAVYIMIPSDIFWTNEANWHLISVFSYFAVKRGLDNTVNFSVNGIVRWLCRQENRNKSGINSKVIECLKYLELNGYLSIANPLDNASINEAVFNVEKVRKECDGKSFVILYLDEIRKIMNYQKSKREEYHFGSEVVLTLFVYLKLCTFKRPNKLRVEEVGGGGQKDIDHRKRESPEAFDAYYYQIAEDLGLSSRTVSGAAKVLSDLGLVYYEELPRYKHKDEWRTDHTIFCFMYKREKGKLLASGKSYYETEIENKKKKLALYRKKKSA